MTYGPGTALKQILATWGFKERPGCRCGKYAGRMDRKGPDWCEKHINIILEWLKESAHERKLPFVPFIARMLVKEAINRSRGH